MAKLADIYLNRDMDIELVQNADGSHDLKMDNTLQNSVRIALMTSSKWWANQYGLVAGSRIGEIYRRGKLSEGILREIKQAAENALKFLLDYCDEYSVEVIRNGTAVEYSVIINNEGKQELWKFQA